MTVLKKLNQNKTLQILFLFILFHVFWLVFYLLSDVPFLKNGRLQIYMKVSIINTLGFAAFCFSTYLLFPKFISRKKYFLLAITSLIIILFFGYLQYLLQDWFPEPFFKKTIPASPSSKVFKSQVIRQVSGAYIRATLNIMVYILLGLGFAYMKDWFIKDRRTRILEQEKTAAELSLLRYQLNPHFLFNTINNIYYLAIIKSEKTADAILKVSELLRYVLDQKEDSVPLEKELDHLRKLIQLQEFRFPDQIVELNIKVEEDINSYQIAPLLLTTFAENAFKHGEPGNEEDPVKISLSVRKNLLTYYVVNKIHHDAQKDSTSGIGINNLKKRLALLYEEKYKLELKEENDYFKAHLELQLV